ncbi:MAG TPA: hypothetical protein VGP94_13740 [Tepidisphaeraceae bacterium]|nr:hypothetical protein [Tepidisphaeraceae bacterium]
MFTTRRARILALGASVILAAFFWPRSTHAVTRSWTNPAGGNFNLNTNWSGSTVPGAADTALFDTGTASPYTVTFSAASTLNDRLIIGRDNVTFDLSTHSYTLTNGVLPGVTVGEIPTDHGTFHLIHGSISDENTLIGRDLGSTGSVTISNIGGRLEDDGLPIIGSAGAGQLRIDTNGLFRSNGGIIAATATSTSSVTVTDPGSSWICYGTLNIGQLGNATLTVQNGGSVQGVNIVFVRGASSSMTITGANSFLSANTLNVGPSGAGAMTIGSGGYANITTDVLIGGTANINGGGTLRTARLDVSGTFDAASTGIVSIDDSPALGTSAGMGIGVAHSGSMFVHGGGDVTYSGAVYIAERAGAAGSLQVSGAGSTWFNSSFLDIGSRGAGTLTVDTGAVVTGGFVYVAPFTTSTGTAVVDGTGSRLGSLAPIHVGGSELGDGGIGTLTVRNSGMADTGGTIFVHPAGTINLQSGTVVGSTLDIRGGTVNHTGGILRFTTGFATPTVTGIYIGIGGSGSTGTLNISAGGRLNTVNNAVIAQSTGSSGNATVSGPGSRWNHTGDLSLGTSTSTNAVMNINSGGVVSNSGSSSVAGALGSTATVTVTGPGSLWDTTGILGVATNGTATINVTNGGALRNANAYLAVSSTGDAQINVNTAGATWNTSGGIFLGGNEVTAGGHASLAVGAGAPTVTASNLIQVWPFGQIQQDSGTIVTPTINVVGGIVTQNGGQILSSSASVPPIGGTFIGNGAIAGALNITSAGRFTTTGNAQIGYNTISTGTAAIDGAGSVWTINGPQVIGSDGHGTMTIGNKGFVNVSFGGYVGLGSGEGHVFVDGSSTRWTMGGQLDVGDFGIGTVSITNGALVTNTGPAFIGRYASGNGSVTVNGTLSELRTDQLFIGGDLTGPGNTGLVHVENNGKLTVTNATTIWPAGTLQMYPTAITTTELRLRGGTLSTYGNFLPPISNGGGTLEVPASQTLSVAGLLTSLAGAQLTRTGAGVAVINGPQSHATGASLRARGGQTIFNTNAGTPATPASPATANLSLLVGPDPAYVALNSNQEFANLTVDTASPGRQGLNLFSPAAPGGFRSLRVYPNSTTKASLWAAIANANRAGADPFDGIYDSSLSSHPSSGIGLAKVLDPHGESVFLIRPTRIGDLNLDGSVTISDFIDLAANFNASGPNITWQEGDLNYDNAVTISDFIELSANFGSSYAGASIPMSPSDLSILNDFAASQHVALPTSVPEPALLLLLPFASLFQRRHCLCPIFVANRCH